MMDPSKERSFNDHWKKAFEEASVTPPESVWEGIEARLDQGDPSRIFEDQWRKAFEETSMMPPTAAWEGIEQRLDEKDDAKIIPLWWRSPKLWYAAASMLALLVTGGLWLQNVRRDSIKIESIRMASKGKSGSGHNLEGADSSISGASGVAAIRQNNTPASEPLGISKNQHANESDVVKTEIAVRRKDKIQARPESSDATGINPVGAVASVGNRPKTAADNKVSDTEKFAVTSQPPVSSRNNLAERAVEPVGNRTDLGRPVITADMLAALPFKERDVYFQKRYVFYKEQAEQIEPVIKKHQEYWAGVGLMPASFNPDVNIKNSPASFASKSYASQKSLTGKNDPGFSYAVQTQGGMRISKHWSVETGITYLQGNSQYEGGGYLLDAATFGSSNVLENAYADLQAGKGPGNALVGTNNSTLYIDVSKQVRNDYRYLQLPVQAGFTLNPDGKLSYSVLGGMMANFFLNNELESASGNVIKTTAADEVYRGTSWAATTGLRFNYKLSSRWKASLTGSYQKAVTSGFRSNQNLESHPYLYGVSWGMRYSF